MNKKIFYTLLSILFFLPAYALAAGTDVSLTTSTVIQVGPYALNVTGSTATLQSITVNDANFTVTLASGSSISISSPTLNKISTDITSDVTENTCNDSQSLLTLSYAGAGTVTNTITVSATSCSTQIVPPATTQPTSTGSSGSSSSGGGQISPQALAQLLGQAPMASTSTTVTSLPSRAPSAAELALFAPPLRYGIEGENVMGLQNLLVRTGYLRAEPTGYFGGQTRAAILNLQRAYRLTATGEVGPATATVLATLLVNTPGMVALVATSSTPDTFDRNLSLGSTGTDVRRLQVFLNAHNFLVATGGAGSTGKETDTFGNLTFKAVQRFQKENGLPATGFFGPLTRARIQSFACSDPVIITYNCTY